MKIPRSDPKASSRVDECERTKHCACKEPLAGTTHRFSQMVSVFVFVFLFLVTFSYSQHACIFKICADVSK